MDIDRILLAIDRIDADRDAIAAERRGPAWPWPEADRVANGSHLLKEGSTPASTLYNSNNILNPSHDFPIIPDLGPIPGGSL